ncbi:hypothetical protein [Arenimonas sp. MALMAid1274]|uniref:hypothetical protein n=1 Tax=Arenimonas sp. MALMAid1274 TaxID=3411630 RepID=UPI003BA002A1
MRNLPIPWPALLVELDTTGVTREDQVIQVVCALVDKIDVDGALGVVAQYAGLQQPQRPSSPEAFAVHGLTDDVLCGKTFDRTFIADLVGRAACIVSRHPRFTARKLHGLAPQCLEKRWHEYPDRIQGYPYSKFPANERMEVLTGKVESFGYGRLHSLGRLRAIQAERHTLVFDENGPPLVEVKFGRRKVLQGFPEALLKCEEGTRFRLHGTEDHDFITGYCDGGPADRDRAFRLAITPSNLELANNSRREVYLDRIDGLTYHLALTT